MANLAVPMNMKRKDAEVGNHGFSIFLDPKRIKLQDCEMTEMMEDDKPSAHAPTATAPTIVHNKVNTASSGGKSSEPPFSADQTTAAAPMDVETDGGNASRRPSMLPSGQVSSEWNYSTFWHRPVDVDLNMLM